MNGWNSNNSELREKIASYRKSDIISINETHLRDDEKINISCTSGYKWVGHNRSKQHIRARKGFGGVGLFVKLSVYENYRVTVEFNEYDDMIGVQFVNKNTDYCFIVYSIYLPPENSTVYNNAPEFFNRLLLDLYKRVDADAIYFAGDLNAKLGELKDYSDIDKVSPRKVLYKTVNNHRKALREFLLESKCCVLNSRVTPENDNYTFVSTRGTSIVDYIISPHDCVKQVQSCHVDLCADIVSELRLEQLLSDRCKTPDHTLFS